MATIEVTNGDNVLVLNDSRNVLTLLAKGSFPSGTMFQALGGVNGAETYAFGLTPGNADYGLTIWDADGTTVLFDAVQYGRAANVVGVMNGNITSTDTQTISQTFAAGRTYAVWLSSPVSSVRPRNISVTVGGTINYFYVLDDQSMSVSVNGATVSITATRINSDQPLGVASAVPYDGAGKTTWTAMVLDVTNF